MAVSLDKNRPFKYGCCCWAGAGQPAERQQVSNLHGVSSCLSHIRGGPKRKEERKKEKKKKKKKLGRLLAATKGGSAFLARPNLANIITQHTPFRLNHLGKLNFLFVCVCVSLRLPLSDCFSLAGKKRGLKHTHSSHSTSLGLWGRVIRAVFFFLAPVQSLTLVWISFLQQSADI